MTSPTTSPNQTILGDRHANRIVQNDDGTWRELDPHRENLPNSHYVVGKCHYCGHDILDRANVATDERQAACEVCRKKAG